MTLSVAMELTILPAHTNLFTLNRAHRTRCVRLFILMDNSRIVQLLAEIKENNAAYRAGHPTISDVEYDKLVNELKTLDPDNEWLKNIEPAAVNKGRKVKLPIPMKSLNKVKSVAEISQWLTSMAIPENAKLVITPKFDGVSWLRDEFAKKTYSRGGADNEGQDCTPHYDLLASYKEDGTSNLHYTFGELVFDCKTWERELAGKVSDATGEKFKSPRNTVAGLINREEPSEIIKHTTFYRYGVSEMDLENYQTYSQLLQTLCEKYHQHIYGTTVTVAELDESKLAGLFKAWRKEFYIDGLVIYLDDINLWKAIGRQQTTGNPLYAIAYKHPDFTDVFETTVKGIDWKISKSGALKPVVNMDAVDTGDCTMENPTGYNAKYIFENGIGPGARIAVTRSGGVIPKIINVMEEATAETMIEQRDSLLYCPDCGQPTKWNDTKVELICTNPECPGIRLAKIVHFYATLETEQMGEETIAKMFKAGYDTLQRILDITFDELMLIEGFGESIANVILAANKKIRDGIDIIKLMHASDCFSGIGQVKARSIVSNLSATDRLAFTNGYVFTEEGFDKTPQFLALNKTMQSFLKGITPFYDFVARNRLKILPMEEPKKPTGDKYAGMKVCFTGVRDKELEAEIAAQGGEVVNCVSKNTTHLIVADINSSSNKTAKAKSLGIPILTIEDFKRL